MDRLLVDVVVSVIIVGLLVSVSIQIMQSGLDDDFVDTGPESVAPLIETDSFVSIKDRTGEGRGETVYNSRGRAIQFTGANDSYLESDSTVTIASDDNWTVATWARVNDTAGSETMTAFSANGQVLIQYNGSDGNWSVWYYDEGGRNSYRVNVSAPNQPGNLSWIAAWNNGTHLAIYRNGTRGDVIDVTGDNIVDVNVNATSWHGTLEESRTFDEALNDSQRQAVRNAPNYPLANATRTGRLMYDREVTSGIRIYHTDATATASNVTYVSGFPNETMAAGVDYEWQEYGPKIKALSGGRLDAAPVAFVDFGFSEKFSRLIMVKNWETLTNMIRLLFTVMILVVIGAYLLLIRGR